jgi:Family of unknown function (DUF6152)
MRHAARTLVLSAILTLAAGTTALPHHSVSGQFDTTKLVTITGVISRIDWVNPHIYVLVDGKDESGGAGQWALETVPTAMARKAKLTKDQMAGNKGDTVTVVGHPARDGRKSAWVLRITYSDGRFLQLSADRK